MFQIVLSFVVGLIAAFLFEAFPLQLIHIFGSEDGLYKEFAVYCCRIYLSFLVGVFMMVSVFRGKKTFRAGSLTLFLH